MSNKFRLLANMFESTDPSKPSGNFIRNYDISTLSKQPIHELVTQLISLGIYAEINRFDNNLSVYGNQKDHEVTLQTARDMKINLL